MSLLVTRTHLTPQERRMAKAVQNLTPKALKRLAELIDSPEGSVALGAVREVLARTIPVPKTSLAAVAAAAAGGAAAGHMAALREIAERRLAADQAKVIEAESMSTPLDRV